MIISGMNRYFAKHGKITFGLIAIVISVSFVLYLSRVSVFDLFRSKGPKTVSILGRKVSAKDRLEAARKAVLFAALKNPMINLRRLPVDPSANIITRDLVQFYAATDLGIRVGDDSVVKYIRNVPAFQTNGKFDIAKYNDFVKNRLAPAHYSKADLDEAVRRELAVKRLQDSVLFNVLTTKDELRAAFDSARQKAKAQVIWFSGSDFESKVAPTTEDVKNYFASHQAEYIHPAKAKAKLVRFPYDKYRAAAVKTITTTKIEQYYNKNRFMYLQAGKTGKDGGPVYKPLADVTDNIRKFLVERETKALAFRDATRFADQLYAALEDMFYKAKTPEAAREKCLPIFNNLLAKANLKAEESGWLPLDNSSPLATALGELRRDNPVSEPIKGTDTVTVALLLGKQPAKPKTFEEAEKEARKDFIKTRAVIIARETAKNAALKLAEALKAGTDFKKAVADLKLKAESLPEVRISTPLAGPYGSLVVPTIFDTPAKNVSQARTTKAGAFVVYVEDKKLPSDQDFKQGSRMFEMIYEMRKKQSIYEAFLSSLLAASAPAVKE